MSQLRVDDTVDKQQWRGALTNGRVNFKTRGLTVEWIQLAKWWIV
jgi:hypothetical protein